MIEAILFDFGQTLVDSADGFRAAERDVQRKLFAQLDGLTWDEFIDHYRRTRKALQDQSQFSRVKIWRAVYDGFDRDPDLERLVRWECEYWQTVNRHTAPFPEATRVLDRLRRDYRLALISNTQGEVEGEGHRLKHFPGLTQFFEVIIVSGENGIKAKPDPQPFRLCLQNAINLQVTTVQSCVKIDDTIPGVEEGLNAGMWTIGLAISGNEVGLMLKEWEALPPEEQAIKRERAYRRMQQGGAHYVVDTIADIMPSIGDIQARIHRGETP